MDLVYIYQNLAIAHTNLGRYDDALYCLERTIGSPLLSLEAYHKLWIVYQQTRKPEEFLRMTLRLFDHYGVYKQYPNIRRDTVARGKKYLIEAGRADLAAKLE